MLPLRKHPALETSSGVELAPSRAEEARWRTLLKRVKVYGWLSLTGALAGSVYLSHPRLFGRSRSTLCRSRGAAWALHFIEVPMMACISTVALYALRRFDRTTARRFSELVGLSNMVKLTFFGFESAALIGSFPHGAKTEEKLTYVAGAFLLLTGTGVGLWVRLGVHDYFHPALDPRFAHPQTEEELIQLVKHARASGVQLRVRGSTHCVPGGIYTDDSGHHINVQLDRYTRIVGWDEGARRVTVQAGCHLGVDPHDPLSNEDNSLLSQLEARDWALPDLGGITHQTVGGFLSTGSMGGTARHDLGAALVGIRLIDGTGRVHDLSPGDADFHAAGVSMGLLGIISTVTLQCEPRYDLVGKQVTCRTRQCAISLFEPGEKGLRHFFETNEDTYSRLLWWPQRGVDKVQLWRAHRETGTGSETYRPALIRRPFVAIPRVLQVLVNLFFKFIAHDDPPYGWLTEKVVRLVLNVFVPKKETKEFRGSWHEILPMDNGVSDELVPTDFTEFFIDIDQAAEVMKLLEGYFNPDPSDKEGVQDAKGMGRTGPYAFEIYAGFASSFWMSPSHGRHSIRVDVFWFRTDKEHARENFYERFWELLAPFGFRLHWGKFLPKPDSLTGVEYLRRQYPMWDRFMEVRQRMDPDGVFLSRYWKEHLGIEPALARSTPVGSIASSCSGESA
ncbi:FAD-binding protein [Archangium violaceum]|uniref:D-arabinono-1,4-lactone oxidase n=1 Tax=Archangium violaceum TaxID=83451 RepID=UPI00194EEDA8|nr:D-arabinono-1,4-lactone oxidase [Archangium violaceum]QRO02218.1 FAD-binding protein [Archangium violaceum]